MLTADMSLLAEFARTRSETAFAALVSRHVNLVYSVALRRVADPHLAEDITQAVFIVLARKAGILQPGTILPAWLCRTAHYASGNALKAQHRRVRREQEAAMQSLSHEPNADPWQDIAPSLDSALAELKQKDHDALVLRFFQNLSLAEVGQALGISEMAAGKRVNRALEKLRKLLRKRHHSLSAAVIAAALTTHAVQAAPASTAAAATAAALSQGAAVPPPTLALATALSKTLTWMRWRLPLALTAAVVISAGLAALLFVNRPPATPPPAAVPGKTEEPSFNTPREPLARVTLLTLITPPGSVAVQPDGKILAGSTLGGLLVDDQSGALGYYTRGALRFDTNGLIDPDFRCGIDRSGSSSAMMAHISLLNDGRIFLTGLFNTVDDQPRPGQVLLLPDGALDSSYEPWRGYTNATGPHQTFRPEGALLGAILADGSLAVLSGSIQGPRAPHPLTVYRFDSTGNLLPPTGPTLAGGEFSRPSGLILTLGPVGFWARKPVDWTRATPAPRRPPFSPTGPASDLPAGAPVVDLPFERWLAPPSAADAAVVLRGLFEEVPIELCRYAVRLPDGGALLAVRDEVINGSMQAHGRFMRFDKNWRPDFSFSNLFEADLRSCLILRRQPDGRFLLGGLIGTINGEPFPGLVRLEPSGAIDHTFHCETTNALDGRVMDIALQDDGRIVIGGFFSRVNGIDCPHLARLNPDGSLDSSFRPPFLSLQEFSRHRFPVQHLTQPTSPSPQPGPGPPPSASSAPDTVLITSLTFEAGAAVLQIRGRPSTLYILQARNDLAAAQWLNLSTNRTSPSGGATFRDPSAKAFSIRFYRLATP